MNPMTEATTPTAPLRIQPLRALGAMSRLIGDPTDTKLVFEIIQALAGKAPTRLLARMQRDRHGRRLLAAKPDLLQRLLDREALAAMPDGSVGRAYLTFIEREGITADGLVQASHDGDARGWHDREDDFGFIAKRLRDTHDLWHVLTGYGGDVLGEVALLAFSAAQTGNRGVAFIATMAVLRTADRDVAKMVASAFIDGKKAAWLPGLGFEELLVRPLDEVRRELAITPVGPYVRRRHDWVAEAA